MGKTSLTYITKENEELSAGINKLKTGDLSVSELDDLTNNAKSLYEALVVLRYKAFEKHMGRDVETEVSPIEAPLEEKETSQEIVEKEEPSFTGFDLTASDEEAKEPVVEEDDSPTMFDFSGSSEVEETPEVKTEKKEEFDVNSFDEEEEETTETNLTIPNDEEEEDDSLYSQFKDTRDASLRKQLGRTPIADLKSEIGIAKKFEYINSMFNGKTEMYDAAINDLNTCGSDEAAKNLLNDYAQEYNWDLDDKSIIKFIELVERRYI